MVTRDGTPAGRSLSFAIGGLAAVIGLLVSGLFVRGPAAWAGGPQLLSVTPDGGCAGDVIFLDGLDFPLAIPGCEVLFAVADGSGAELRGAVLEITSSGVDPQGNLLTELEVLVPTGARSGSVRLRCRQGTQFVDAGQLPFTGCRQVIGVIHGNAILGYAYLDESGQDLALQNGGTFHQVN